MSAGELALSTTTAHAMPRSPAFSRTRTGAWALGIAGFFGAYLAWQLLNPGPVSSRPVVGDAFGFVVAAMALVAARKAASRCPGSPALQRAWRLLGWAMAAFLVGSTLQAFSEGLGYGALPAPVAACYVVFIPLAFAGLCAFPSLVRDRAARLRLALDVAVVGLAAVGLTGYVVLGRSAGEDVRGAPSAILVVVYPAAAVVLIVAVTSLLLRGSVPSARRALIVLAAGFAAYAAGVTIGGYLSLHGGYSGGDAVDCLPMLAFSLFALAATLQRPVAQPELVVARPDRADWLLVIATAVGFGVLLFASRNEPRFPEQTTVMITVLMAILVFGRQLLARLDLERAHNDLRGAHEDQSFTALHDALTGLPNRVLVLDRADQMLAHSRHDGHPLTVFFVDLDGFKYVNESFGHAVGDTLLRHAAARLAGCVRDVDTVGRFGGDEFVILLDPDGPDNAERVAQRILRALRDPIDAGTRRVMVTASIGIAAADAGASADEVVRQADLALYAAKRAGKDRYAHFEPGMSTTAADHLTVELDLREAIAERQFELHYQPLYDAATRRVVAVEALIRWNHPERGQIGPGAFIPNAEESGLIVPIGRFVLDQACAQAAVWQRQGRALGMGVNVSARQLDDEAIVDDVRDALARSGLDPSSLVIEITETALMRNVESAKLVLQQLHSLGVHLAIDDFGTGYSSLSHVRDFPVDSVKIDRAFVAGITESPASGPFVHTLIELAKAVGLTTIGEGVETDAQYERLCDEGCDFVQGFLLSKPLPLEELERLLAAEGAADLERGGGAAVVA